MPWVADIVLVVVPVEEGLARFLHRLHQDSLYLVEYVEPCEDHCIVPIRDAACNGRVLPQCFCHLPEHGTLVHGAALLLHVAQTAVYGVHVVPQAQEPFLDDAVACRGEVAEEMRERVMLLLCQVAEVVQAMQVVDVGEHCFCLGEMLVHVVEVGQYDFAPAPELVNGLWLLALGCQYFVIDAV